VELLDVLQSEVDDHEEDHEGQEKEVNETNEKESRLQSLDIFEEDSGDVELVIEEVLHDAKRERPLQRFGEEESI
jgi:hypothetical protein